MIPSLILSLHKVHYYFVLGTQCKGRSWNWEAAAVPRIEVSLTSTVITDCITGIWWPDYLQDFQAQEGTHFTKKIRLLFLWLKIFPITDSISYRCFTVICLLTGIRWFQSHSTKLQLTSKGFQFCIKNGST